MGIFSVLHVHVQTATIVWHIFAFFFFFFYKDLYLHQKCKNVSDFQKTGADYVFCIKKNCNYWEISVEKIIVTNVILQNKLIYLYIQNKVK